MLKRNIGVAALAISSLFGLTPIAAAHDYDRYNSTAYNGDGYYRGLSPHERRELERRRERLLREEQRRLARERQRAAQNGYYNNGPYGTYNNNGYYDQYGYWHPYRR